MFFGTQCILMYILISCSSVIVLNYRFHFILVLICSWSLNDRCWYVCCAKYRGLSCESMARDCSLFWVWLLSARNVFGCDHWRLCTLCLLAGLVRVQGVCAAAAVWIRSKHRQGQSTTSVWLEYMSKFHSALPVTILKIRRLQCSYLCIH